MLALALCLLVLPRAPQERRVVPAPLAQEPQPQGDLRLALYDVAQLTGHADLARSTESLARRPADEASRAWLDFQELERQRTQCEAQRDGLLAALREGLRPPLEGGARLEWLEGGRIALLGRAEQHAWIAAFLANAQTFDGLYDVQTVLWSAPRSAGLGDLLRRHGDRLSPAAASNLLARLDDLALERTTAPRIVCFPFSSVELSVGSELAYVADWEFLELTDRGDAVPAPVVEHAFDGLHLVLRCIPLDGERVRLDCDVRLTTLQRPIPSRPTAIRVGSELVTIQVPEWTTARVEGHVDLAPGETMLLAAEDAAADRIVLVLLGARVAAAEVLPPEER